MNAGTKKALLTGVKRLLNSRISKLKTQDFFFMAKQYIWAIALAWTFIIGAPIANAASQVTISNLEMAKQDVALENGKFSELAAMNAPAKPRQTLSENMMAQPSFGQVARNTNMMACDNFSVRFDLSENLQKTFTDVHSKYSTQAGPVEISIKDLDVRMLKKFDKSNEGIDAISKMTYEVTLTNNKGDLVTKTITVDAHKTEISGTCSNYDNTVIQAVNEMIQKTARSLYDVIVDQA